MNGTPLSERVSAKGSCRSQKSEGLEEHPRFPWKKDRPSPSAPNNSAAALLFSVEVNLSSAVAPWDIFSYHTCVSGSLVRFARDYHRKCPRRGTTGHCRRDNLAQASKNTSCPRESSTKDSILTKVYATKCGVYSTRMQKCFIPLQNDRPWLIAGLDTYSLAVVIVRRDHQLHHAKR